MTYKGWENFVPNAQAAPKSKFGNKAVEVDGIRFDSKREAARYQVLKLRMQAGEIQKLRCHPRYDLCAHVDDRPTFRQKVAEWEADFEYEEVESGEWTLVVEDVKGHRTDVYKLKKRWFEAQYGMTIRET